MRTFQLHTSYNQFGRYSIDRNPPDRENSQLRRWKEQIDLRDKRDKSLNQKKDCMILVSTTNSLWIGCWTEMYQVGNYHKL